MRNAHNIVSLSVVTYTYNDASLVVELLRNIRTWTIQPMEIIVVDDCSAEPFTAPEMRPPVRVLRMEKNLGPTGAKTAGLSAAEKKFVLSLDCDTQLCPDWVEKCLPLLHDPEIGIVSSHILSDSGTDDLSVYIDKRYSFTPLPGKVTFIPGCAFLMRREVFHKTGGFSGHTKRTNDDAFFCKRLQECGYALRVAPDVTAYQVRRISIAACIKRAFEWDRPYFERNFAEGKPFEELFATFVIGLKMKTGNTTRQEIRLLYFDLLFMFYGSLTLAMDQQRLPQAREAVWNTFHVLLAGYPCLRSHLEKDMRRLFPRHACSPAPETAKLFEGVAPLFKEAFPPDFLVELEAFLHRHAITETPDAHFSHYELM